MPQTHGHTGSPTYRCWAKMLSRCRDERNNRYARYGGRGIKVYGPWLRFENFLADMGERPSKLHTIDRIDSNGDYETSNCQWLLNIHQSKTRATNHYITFNGKTQTAADWGREIGIKGWSVIRRIDSGWSLEDALTKPAGATLVGKRPGNSVTVTFRGQTKDLAVWAKELGIGRVTLWQRIYKYGWPIERAITEPARGWAPGKPRPSGGA